MNASRPKPPKIEYKTLARWRNGWSLVEHPTNGQKYLRRMMRGMHKVDATVSGNGLLWRIINPDDGQPVHPERFTR